MYCPRSNRCDQNPGWFRVSWGVVLPRCIAINYCRMNLDRNSFKPISKMKWFKGFEHWSRYLLAIATLLLCSATFDDFDHWTYSLFCWQGQHEETFFKSTSPCFEWDGFGLGARSWCFLCEVPSKCQPQKRQFRTEEDFRAKFQPLQSFPTFPHPSRFFLLSWDLGIPSWCQEVGGFVWPIFEFLHSRGILQQFSRRKSSVKT